jgi:hypothetical protein
LFIFKISVSFERVRFPATRFFLFITEVRVSDRAAPCTCLEIPAIQTPDIKVCFLSESAETILRFGIFAALSY